MRSSTGVIVRRRQSTESRPQMADELSRTCIECQGVMSPIVVMDKFHPGPGRHLYAGELEYRLPEDRLSFWTGKYPTAGYIQAFLCASCGRISLYAADTET